LRDVLDDGALGVLEHVRQQVDKRWDGRQEWAFNIGGDWPLAFRQSDKTDTGIPVKIDISGHFRQPVDGRPVLGHSVVIRVWATVQGDCFDAAMDSANLRGRLTASGRVVNRFLFDIVDSPREPWSHLHFGGMYREPNEFCRIPEGLSVPRFVHHPIGLIQACEFVLYHFYPAKFDEVRDEKKLWVPRLQIAERAYLKVYASRLNRVRPGQIDRSFHLQTCAPA
jgi:hypothetical protein